MKQITSAAELIKEMGGQTALARKLRTHQPEVGRWKRRGWIAPRYSDAVRELIRGKGLSVSPEVFGMRKIEIEAEQS